MQPGTAITNGKTALGHIAMSWLVMREAVRAFLANSGLETAATLAYYGFLALAPLLLLVVYFLGVILSSSDTVLESMRAFTAHVFPKFSQELLAELLNFAQQGTWGLISVVLLIWSLTPFAGALRSAYLRTFKLERTRSFLVYKLRDLGAVLLLLAIFVLLVAVNALYFVRSEFLLPGSPGLVAVLKGASLLLLTFAILILFEKVFVPVRMPWPVLLLGAFTVAVLLAAIRPLFDLLLRFNPNYGYAFGSLKTIFLLIIWVYYTFAVLLFGAEMMAAAWRRETLVLRRLFAGHGKRPPAAVLLEPFAHALAPGALLFRQGDPGAAMFYVLEGAIELVAGSQKLRVLQAGEYFGEMAMLLEAARTATAQAGPGGARVARIERGNFDLILRENPQIVRALLKEMADRLKATNLKLNGPAD
jgi:membrane protein